MLPPKVLHDSDQNIPSNSLSIGKYFPMLDYLPLPVLPKRAFCRWLYVLNEIVTRHLSRTDGFGHHLQQQHHCSHPLIVVVVRSTSWPILDSAKTEALRIDQPMLANQQHRKHFPVAATPVRHRIRGMKETQVMSRRSCPKNARTRFHPRVSHQRKRGPRGEKRLVFQEVGVVSVCEPVVQWSRTACFAPGGHVHYCWTWTWVQHRAPTPNIPPPFPEPPFARMPCTTPATNSAAAFLHHCSLS
mmetsp:Transcript_12958/g.15815  ORF Transcript_12958/g.15815 Transcript_12958/m.15815 type:complete len:244 (+) Transcript_12958:622-1353(+)